MDLEEKTCQTCGHSCHCYGPDCESCSCDVCDCGTIKKSMEDVPPSFINPNT